MAYLKGYLYSKVLEKNVELQIILPSMEPNSYLLYKQDNKQDNFYQQKRKYQTLYLLHDSYDDGNSWLLNTSISRYAQQKCLAVVMPSAENSNYQNMAHGEKYLSYITEELPLVMAKMLPLSKKRENIFIAGNSMGGSGAFRCAFTHPKTYGAAASISGLQLRNIVESPYGKKIPCSYQRAVYGEKIQRSELLGLLQSVDIFELPKLYMACGREDFAFQPNENFYEKATNMGVKLTYNKYDGGRSWNYWDKWIQDLLNWLPLKQTFVEN